MKQKLPPLVLAIVLISACAGPQTGRGNFGWEDGWTSLNAYVDQPQRLDGETCDQFFRTWFFDFGVRGLACGVENISGLFDLVRSTPSGPVWQSGPHEARQDMSGLNFDAGREFGHYSAAFVRAAALEAVPTSRSDVARTQAAYDRYVQRLARVYWLTLADLASEGFPGSIRAGSEKDYVRYLRGGQIPSYAEGYEGGVSVYSLFGDRAEEVMADLVAQDDNVYEVTYEACTAYGFWLRRSEDATWSEFRDGLRSMLEAYDPAWLLAHPG